MSNSDRATRASSLTEQERRVAMAVGSGLSNKAVARDLVVSIKTVEFHLGNVYRKLGIASRVELANLVGSGSSRLFGSSGATVGSDLPPAPNRLVGREAELQKVVELIVANPLVTLTGVGGVGKTSLALAAANQLAGEFIDGVWWVDLAPLGSDRDVASVVASVVRVSQSSGEGSVASLVAALRGTRLLVVLDNCEHVLASTSALCAELLRSCPGLAVLATSRHRLGISVERNVAVRPLNVNGPGSPALRLLIERIDRIGDARDESETAALEEICRRLDGLPLALELAAGRCRTMAATDVASRLRDRFRLLGGRDDSDRSTLLGTVTWSYELLGTEAKTVLARVSAFAASFPLAAAERIASVLEFDDYTVDDALAELVELSLVDFDNGRYRLLETTRAFARELLDARDETEVILDAHLEWIIDFVKDARLGVRGADEAEWVEQLDRAWPDIRAAFHRSLERDDPTAAIELATRLAWEGFYRRPEACAWIEEANRRFGGVPHPHRHELVGAAAFAAWVLGQPEHALLLGQQAMVLDPSPGTAIDRLPEWATLNSLGWTGDVQPGIDLALQTITTLEHEPFLLAFWLATMPIAYSFKNDLETGRGSVNRAIQIASGLNNPSLSAFTSLGASLAHIASEPALAIDILQRGKTVARSVKNSWLEYALTDLELVVSTSLPGRDPLADLQRSIELAQIKSRHGWVLHAWGGLSTIARLLVDNGRDKDAALLLYAFLNSSAGRGDHGVVTYLTHHLAVVLGPEEIARLREEAVHLGLQALIQLAATSPTSQTPPTRVLGG
jgi:predicted ATPase/DNA-binding CsgD family transcriptional regulator